MYETRQTLERNTGQTAERKEDSLTEGVESNSVGDLLVPSDQGTYGRAKGRRPRSRMSDGAVRF